MLEGHGKDGFYQGWIAEAIVEIIKSKSVLEEPVRFGTVASTKMTSRRSS